MSWVSFNHKHLAPPLVPVPILHREGGGWAFPSDVGPGSPLQFLGPGSQRLQYLFNHSFAGTCGISASIPKAIAHSYPTIALEFVSFYFFHCIIAEHQADGIVLPFP